VIAAVPTRAVRTIVVVDNGSRDHTARAAEDAGAVVLREAQVGYGAACLRGVAHLTTLPHSPDAVVFCPADGSCDPRELDKLVEPLRERSFDLVVGSRALGARRLKASARAASYVALQLIRAVYGYRYTDLSPYSAVRYPALVAMGLRDMGYGWLVEMQIKALTIGLRVSEVAVSYHEPSGHSGFADQIKRTAAAASKVLFQILRHSTAR